MFNVNKCASAIAAAMVGTIRTGDDASRFSQRAMAEGFTNISDLIAADAVKQALAIREAINKADPLINQTSHVVPAAKTAEEVFSEAPKIVVDNCVFKEGFDEVDGFGGLRLPAEVVFADSPLTAPAPPAPEAGNTTSTSTTTVNAGNVDVDSEGLPWDGRIHSSNKKKLAKDDTWQLRRGIGADIVEQVKAELRQVMAIPKIDAPSAEVTTTHLPGGVTTAPPPPIEAGNTVPPAAAGTPQTGASSKPYSEYKLPDLMRDITSKMIQPADVAAVVAQFGVPSVPALATRPDLIPLVAEALQL